MTDINEIGKFYDCKGSDRWYNGVYGPSQDRSLPRNEVAIRCIGHEVRGDVAVIRSEPTGIQTPEVFARGVFVKDVEWYRDGSVDSRRVLAEREHSRATKKMTGVYNQIGIFPPPA